STNVVIFPYSGTDTIFPECLVAHPVIPHLTGENFLSPGFDRSLVGHPPPVNQHHFIRVKVHHLTTMQFPIPISAIRTLLYRSAPGRITVITDDTLRLSPLQFPTDRFAVMKGCIAM